MASNIVGRVTQVMGAVIDVQFDGDLPFIQNALHTKIADRTLVLEVAQELGLSEHTIKKYLFRIFEKLGISSRVELVLYAVNNGNPRQAEWLAGTSRAVPSA